jgi:outer membrane protein assembly factor BamB
MRRRGTVLLGALLLLAVAKSDRPLPIRGEVRHDWPQFSTQPLEGRGRQSDPIAAANVARLGVRWRVSLPEVCDGVPLYVSSVITANGPYDLLIVETTTGRLIALDASNGELVWQTTAPSGPRWTTSSPAVDPGRRWVFAYGLDGYVHKYAIETGREVIGGGWPELITAKGDVEKGSSSLTLATARDGNTYLWMTTAAYPIPGDDGDYQGHLVTIDIESGRQSVFNALCSDKAIHFQENGNDANDCAQVQGGIWARSGATYDPVTDRLFITTGNGPFDADRGGYNWGSTVVALRPDGAADGGTPIDSYTPSDHQRITDLDLDLSSSGVVPLPVPRSAGWPRLGVQGGKDTRLRLLNLDDLSGAGGPRHIGGELQIINVPQHGWVLTQPFAWFNRGTSWVFVTNREGTAGIQLQKGSDGQPTLVTQWINSNGGTSPIVANGVLYCARAHQITAMDPTTGDVLWADSSIGDIHWQSPIVVNGMLFIADNDKHVVAYEVQ